MIPKPARKDRPQVRWTRRALSRLDLIGAHAATTSSEAAAALISRIMELVQHAATRPGAGRFDGIRDTARLTLPDLPYELVYRVTPEGIDVLSLMHLNRDWPPVNHDAAALRTDLNPKHPGRPRKRP
jgi:plasmid stabilization system protein ParE